MLTERDASILHTIWACDNLMSPRQIKTLFFGGWTQTRNRLMRLWENGYLGRPEQRSRGQLADMVYWVDDAGLAHLAGLAGVTPAEFGRRKAPRSTIPVRHHLLVNDVRIVVMQACQQQMDLELETWIPEADFRKYPRDTVEFNRDGKRIRRQIIPDGYFAVRCGNKRFPFLIEVDLRTEDRPRIVQDKVLPGLAYLRSAAYARRCGCKNTGNWLFITTGQRRLHNLKQQVERIAGRAAGVFWYTTLDRISADNVFTVPIWYRGGQDGPGPLLPSA